MRTRRSASPPAVDQAAHPPTREREQLNRREKQLLRALAESDVGDFMGRRRIVVELHVVRQAKQEACTK